MCTINIDVVGSEAKYTAASQQSYGYHDDNNKLKSEVIHDRAG
jgi:hypothetical protein